MTGVLVEDHAFALDNFELDPVYNFVPPSSPLSCADHGFKGMFSAPFSQEGITLSGFKSGNQGSMTISPSQGMDYVGNAAEKGIGAMGFMGAYTAEKGNGGMGSVGKSPSFTAEKGNGGMDYVGKLALHGAQKKGSNDELLCRSISGMGVMDGDGQGYVGNARDDVGDVHQGYMGEIQGYVGDLQASMACTLPVVGDSLQRFLPPNNEDYTMDFFSCDEFRMYDFKVRRCMRGRSHDWTECPFAHPGEKARRRDPRRFHYSGTACPDFRKGNCRRGDSCELSHGVFECWLHPARYRTQICKDGKACKRRVCFFAHSPFQLRLVSPDAVAPSSNNGFSLKSAMASSIDDGFPSYTDVTLNRPPSMAHNGSPLRSASTDGYHADGFFDGFNPKNSHGFPTDGFFDGFSPNTSHGHSHSHSHGHGLPIDGFFYGSSPKNSHGLPTDDLLDGFSPKNTHGHSHSHSHSHSRGLPIDRLLVDEYGSQNSHGHSYTHTHSFPPDGFASDGFYDGFSSKNSYARVNLMNKLAHASLTNNIDQILSPTSTLMGHSLSPPPLSPSLSPPESPPISPSTVSSSWSNALARKIASLSGQPASFDVVSQIQASVAANAAEGDGTPASISQFQASLLANWVHSNGAAMFARTHGPSPLSSNNLGNQRHHLDRLNSMPAAIPSHNSTEFIKDQSVQATFKEAHSAQAMARVISSIQQMELRGAGVDMKNKMRSAHLFHSVPNSPNSRWAGQAESWAVNGTAEEPPVQRVESGRGLRAKIYGKLGKEAGFENENPDLGWVNELVK